MINGILFNEKYLELGIKKKIDWLPSLAPHAVIFGSTGSGKTYFCKLLLGKIALFVTTAQVYVCDFKGDDDFSFLNGCGRFYRFDACSDGLRQFYERFQKRQSGEDTSRNMLVQYFDEWSSFLNSIDDKKILESEKRKLANLLMLGRSFNVHIIVSQQRVDAQYFNTARDNFNLVIGLGNLSDESKNMFFHEYKKEMKPDRKRGTGYMLIYGSNLTAITVPVVSDMQKLHSVIKQGVTR